MMTGYSSSSEVMAQTVPDWPMIFVKIMSAKASSFWTSSP